MKITLGQKLRDKVTGFEGIAISRVEYLNGCVQFCLKPKINKKSPEKIEDGIYVDEGQLEVVGDGVSITAKNTGGPSADAPRSTYRG